jgi:PII-like signaling protein
MLIFVNEADLWVDVPLYEVVVKRLRELGVAGATAQAGMMGFGHHHVVHERGLFGLSADRPVTITVVDTGQKIREVIPEVRKLVKEGLILLLCAEPVPLVAKATEGEEHPGGGAV